MIDRLRGARFARWVAVLAVLAIVLAAGALYQSASLARDYQAFPPPGKLVDIGGYRLHINCTGAIQAGSPTVVFESGLGAGSLLWSLVQESLGDRVRACGYDRAGYGWSDPGPTPRTASQLVREIHLLLGSSGEKPPYLLVGHSFGSIVARLYAATYPDEMAGLVLVDPRHEDFFQRMPPDFLKVDQSNQQTAQILIVITPLGITRLLGGTGRLDSYVAYMDPLPPHTKAAALATMLYNQRHWQTAVAERDSIERSFDEVRVTHLRPDLALVVLTAADGVDAWQPAGTVLDQATRDEWMALQEEQAKLTDNGEWVIVPDCGHYPHLDQPDAVASAILGMAIQR